MQTSPDSLSSTSIAARTEALAAFEADIGAARAAELARLRQALSDVEATHTAQQDEARARVERAGLALEAGIGAAASTVAALFARFPDAPRSTAEAIARAWRDLDQRCVAECGGHLSARHLAVAIATVHGLEARVCGRDFWTFNGARDEAARAANSTVKAILDGGNAVIVAAKLAELEVMICELAPTFPADPARLEATCSRATDGAVRAVLAVVDDAEISRTAAYNAAEYAEVAAQHTIDMTRDDDFQKALAMHRHSGVPQGFLP